MTNLLQLSEAVRDRIQPTMTAFGECLWYERRPMPAPSWAVLYRDPWGDLTEAQGGSTAGKFHMSIGAWLSARDEEAARVQMYQLADTQDTVMGLLRDKMITDDLSLLCGRSVKILQGRGLKVLTRNLGEILPMYIDFDVTTRS